MKKLNFRTTAMFTAVGLVTLSMLVGSSAVAARFGSGNFGWGAGNQASTSTSDYIGIDRAKELALADAGIAAADATFNERECKLDGRSKYDVEFTANGYKYEYEIGATDGKVIEKDVERVKSYQKPSTGNTSGTGSSTSTGSTSTSDYIGIDRAKELALADAGIAAADATFNERECKLDGRKYEIEFTANGYEYEYEIGATDGKVIEKDVERVKSSSRWGW